MSHSVVSKFQPASLTAESDYICAYTQNRVLRLSSNLLDLLDGWSSREGTIEEEKKLAKQVLGLFQKVYMQHI